MARSLGEEVLATYRDLDDHYGAFITLWILSGVSWKTADYPRVHAEIDEALQIASTEFPAFRAPLLPTIGWLAIAEGDEQRAAALWEEALDTHRKQGFKAQLALALGDLGWLALRQKDWMRATRYFSEALTVGSSHGEDEYIARGFLNLAMVSSETGQAARAAWLFGAAEAAANISEVVNDSVVNPMRAQYECAAAATRHSLGEAAFAAAWRAGYERPRRLAIADALTKASALESAPGNGAVDPAEVVGSLTRRESEVLRLLVQRHTDPEIAGSLFISPRTVHHHVANIFDKLGVNSRREAEALALRLGLV
jgi:DNA-binding CsgD family transcriptional regulator